MFLRILPRVFRQCQSIRFLSQPVAKPIEMVQPPDMAAAMKFSVIKRAPKKRRLSSVDDQTPETYLHVSALATADWYDLDRLKDRLAAPNTPFQLIPISDLIDDVICVQSKGQNRSHAFIFDDGAVVFWNVPYDEEKRLLEQVTPPIP